MTATTVLKPIECNWCGEQKLHVYRSNAFENFEIMWCPKCGALKDGQWKEADRHRNMRFRRDFLIMLAITFTVLGSLIYGSYLSHKRKEVKKVNDVHVQRYADPEQVGYQGWIEPADRSWIVFVDLDGKPSLFDKRDANGAVVA